MMYLLFNFFGGGWWEEERANGSTVCVCDRGIPTALVNNVILNLS